MDQIHYRSCSLCEAMCGLQIELKDGSIQGFKGDPEDQFSRGHICPKGPELKRPLPRPRSDQIPSEKNKNGMGNCFLGGCPLRHRNSTC